MPRPARFAVETALIAARVSVDRPLVLTPRVQIQERQIVTVLRDLKRGMPRQADLVRQVLSLLSGSGR